MMTETEKMFAGLMYDPFCCEEMPGERALAHELCAEYNALTEKEQDRRERILDRLMPDRGEGVYLQGPVWFDFGTHIRMGKRSYANFNFTVLDENTVTIGDDVFIGPNCTILTPVHPLCWQDRNVFFNEATGRETNLEYCEPVVIGDNCWIGANVTILPGVTIGPGSVIGAGSVVTRDIPGDSLAFGNPCRVYRAITDRDRMRNRPERWAEEDRK